MSRCHFRRGRLCFLIVFAVFASRVLRADEPVSFSRQVRPLLASKCLICHGPDEEHRGAELRLDQRDSVTQDRGGYAAIAPGQPDESALIERITSDDESLHMPPPDSGKQLTAKDIELLKQWIVEGASYEPHWAFIAPKKPELPTVQQTDWPRNPVDQFVLARMETAGLAPSPQADPVCLMRRVYLDLIGLPPTPEEVNDFLADVSFSSLDDAYERLVDRLLASPHYGERWARSWLDLARYADTNGYEKDRERQIWAYRDWVIAALNRDMPFDQFTIEQLAGDLLPAPTLAQKIATGFHRNTLLNEEGGIDPLEFRYYALADRVATTGTTWLGLTLQCCQCHNHKYDPVTQADYYSMMAFWNGADDVELPLPDPDQLTRDRVNSAEAERRLNELPCDETRFAEWLAAQRGRMVAWRALEPVELRANEPILQREEGDIVFVSGDITKHDTYELRLRGDLRNVTAIRLEALPDERLPGNGPGLTYYEGTRGDFFLSEFQPAIGDAPLKIASATETFKGNQFGDNPVSAQLAVDGDYQTGWAIYGRIGERHSAVFVLEAPLENADELRLAMHFGRHFASSLGRFRISVASAPHAQAVDLPERVEQLLAKADDALSAEERDELRREFLLAEPANAEAAKAIRALRMPATPAHTLVLRERPEGKTRPTHVHTRGEYLRTAEEVAPGTPSPLPAFAEELPRNRLGLARWLTAKDHPLTSRVTVNRQWAALFGAGIVTTVEDFGVQGAPPSNQALLDWLAVDFVERGWSLKNLHRLLVLSATYRQSSQVTPERYAADPVNSFLGRASRRRLDAEFVLDSTLRASGLLSNKMGGPGVRPPQPAGVTEVAYGNPSWTPSDGADRYRRGIYTFLKRTAPFAIFQSFDAPTGAACTARRDVSNTPLQALALLNDVLFQESAQRLGEMLAAYQGTDADRVNYAFRRVLTRSATAEECAELTKFVSAQRERLRTGELDAAKIAGGNLEGVPAEARTERAAWTTLARALLTLDEAITRN